MKPRYVVHLSFILLMILIACTASLANEEFSLPPKAEPLRPLEEAPTGVVGPVEVIREVGATDETDVTITIGTGTTLGSFPIYDFWHQIASVQLLTPQEIGSSGIITHLRWDCGNIASGWGARQVKIFLQHTTNATIPTGLSWATMSSTATEVFNSGAQNYTGPTTTGWIEWDITDFQYNGTDHLYVMMWSYRPAYSSSTSHWYYHTAATMAWTRIGDTADFGTTAGTVSANRPNIQLEMNISPTFPNTPVLTSPANGTIGIPLAGTTLTWQPSTNASSYDVYFSTNQALVLTNNPAARVASAITTTSHQVTDLTLGTWYYWRVAARNDSTQEVSYSSVWSFRSFQPALDGIRTIGGTNPDFATISAAIDALNNVGTNTGVTFLIRGGTYNEGPDSIGASAFTGPNARVIFRTADTSAVIINKTGTSGSPHAFKLWNVDYITFDGSHPDAPGQNLITVNAVGAQGYYGFWIGNGSDYNSIKNINVTVGGTSSTFRPIYIYYTSTATPAFTSVGDTVMNCRIQGGYYSFYIYGGSTRNHTELYIANNKAFNFTYYAFYLYYVGNSTFEGNEVFRTTPAANALYGFYSISSLNTNLRFLRNWIYDLIPSATGAVYGMYISSGAGALIANNMINLDPPTGGIIYGMYFGTTQKNVFYNTVRIGGTTTTYNSHAIYYTGVASSDSLVNNILINERTGGTATQYHLCLWTGTGATPFLYANHNLYSNGDESSTDNKFNIRYNATNYNLLTNAHSAGYSMDQNSYTFHPTFVGAPNLHINPNMSTLVESGGMPISISNDFDGQARGMQPDVGADEGNFMPVSYGSIAGFVRDSTAGTPPIEGAVVRAGQYSAITDLNGFYAISNMLSGVYNVRATTACFDTAYVMGVEVDSLGTDTVVFHLLRPILAVSPTSLEFQAQPGTIVSSTVTLSNTGNSTMYWKARGQALTGGVDQRWGPDGGGYEAIDNTEVDYPLEHAFFDILSIGTVALPQIDDNGATTSMDGFSFEFYGTTYNTNIWVCSNGFMQLGLTTGSTALSNTTLPSATFTTTGTIIPCWDDLVTTVRKYYDQANNIFYVQWDGYRYSVTSNTVSFQVQLHGNNNGIVFAYNVMTESALNPTVGIQNGNGANSNFIQCYYSATSGANIPTTMDGYGIAFSQNGWATWLLVSPNEGSIEPGQTGSVFVQVAPDSTQALGTLLNGNLIVTFNGCPSPFIVPIQVAVDTFTTVAENGKLPVEYKLHQNYPNPFNPTTEIRFDLKQQGFTRLSVFDILGRNVVTLVEQELPAGYHSVRFEGQRLAAGVYFYRIESGKFMALKKMVLVK